MGSSLGGVTAPSMSRARRITLRIGPPNTTPRRGDVPDVVYALASGYTLGEIRQWAGEAVSGELDVRRQLALRRVLGR